MRLRFDDSVQAFREEFLAWLAENRPSEEEMAADPALSTAHAPDWARRWARRLFDAGWLVPGWPPELGGRNAGPVETLVYREALMEEGVPRSTNPQGLGIVAPSILDYGNAAQIEAFAMPLLRGEMTACLGMSEPGAGSDLASLRTSAVRDGDEWVISGQKIWTSGAAYADFCFLFCRTDPTVAKHRGISIVLVPLDTPGVTVKPLQEIVHPDTPDLAEVFFDDARVPIENLVGEENNGWRMANGSLAHERGMVWLDSVFTIQSWMEGLLELTPRLMEDLSPHERAATADGIASLYIESQAVRALGYRGFARLVKGGNAPEQSLMKLYTSEVLQAIGRFGAERNGPAALERAVGKQTEVGTIEHYYSSFAWTISAGASEIQRNIIAERVLGLPRD